jgi:hypothetical protein
MYYLIYVMFTVSEVPELWSGHEYSSQSLRDMTQVRFDDVIMTTTLMIQLEGVGIAKF